MAGLNIGTCRVQWLAVSGAWHRQISFVYWSRVRDRDGRRVGGLMAEAATEGVAGAGAVTGTAGIAAGAGAVALAAGTAAGAGAVTGTAGIAAGAGAVALAAGTAAGAGAVTGTAGIAAGAGTTTGELAQREAPVLLLMQQLAQVQVPELQQAQALGLLAESRCRRRFRARPAVAQRLSAGPARQAAC